MMEPATYQIVMQRIRSSVFARSKRDVVKSTKGSFNPDQVAGIVNNFTHSGDKREVLHDICLQQRLIPMNCQQAQAIIKSATFGKDKLAMLEMIARFIYDKEHPTGRQQLVDTFVHRSEKIEAESILNKPENSYNVNTGHTATFGGPVNYPNVGMRVETGLIAAPKDNSVSYVARNLGTTLFGNMFQSANLPTERGQPIHYPGGGAPAAPHQTSYPAPGHPMYATPTSSQPGYGAPPSYQPGYAAPPPNQPGYAAPPLSQPGYPAQNPGQPAYGVPPHNLPVSSAPPGQLNYPTPGSSIYPELPNASAPPEPIEYPNGQQPYFPGPPISQPPGTDEKPPPYS